MRRSIDSKLKVVKPLTVIFLVQLTKKVLMFALRTMQLRVVI